MTILARASCARTTRPASAATASGKRIQTSAAQESPGGRVGLGLALAGFGASIVILHGHTGKFAELVTVEYDDGDRTGREAGAPGGVGALARATHLDADPVSASADPELAALIARQRVLEEQAEALKLRRASMPPVQWESQFEKLMIELARVSRAIRARS